MATRLTLATANALIEAAFVKAGELSLKPLSVAVLDPGGHPIAFQRQDGASNLRFKMAHAKAHGVLALGLGSRVIAERAGREPSFIAAVNTLADGALLPVRGGVLIRDAEGTLLGAVGITGDTSEQDEICALAGIEAVGLIAEP